MQFRLKETTIFSQDLKSLPDTKLLITTINAYSYNLAQSDLDFQKALQTSHVLLPDGISIVFAMRVLKGMRIKKIAGADLFQFELERLNKNKGSCFFLGSSDEVLNGIKMRLNTDYPGIRYGGYSPPFKKEFSDSDSSKMIDEINEFEPDVLFIGMTAPKQEKWAFRHFQQLNTGHVCCIGAVFDFYGGKIHRAPDKMIWFGLEWFYRLVKEPKRLWKRYLIGNTRFLLLLLKEITRF